MTDRFEEAKLLIDTVVHITELDAEIKKLKAENALLKKNNDALATLVGLDVAIKDLKEKIATEALAETETDNGQ